MEAAEEVGAAEADEGGFFRLPRTTLPPSGRKVEAVCPWFGCKTDSTDEQRDDICTQPAYLTGPFTLGTS